MNQEFERNFGGNAADVYTTALEGTALCIQKFAITNKYPVVSQPLHGPDVSPADFISTKLEVKGGSTAM